MQVQEDTLHIPDSDSYVQHALMVGKPGEGTPALCCLRGWERRIPPTELLLKRKVWSSDSQGLCDLHSISIHRAAPSSFNYRRVVRLIDLTFLSGYKTLALLLYEAPLILHRLEVLIIQLFLYCCLCTQTADTSARTYPRSRTTTHTSFFRHVVNTLYTDTNIYAYVFTTDHHHQLHCYKTSV